MRRIIFFDIDDTLYRRSEPFCRAAAAFFSGRPCSGICSGVCNGDVSLCRQQTTSPLPDNRHDNRDVSLCRQQTTSPVAQEAFKATQRRCEEVYFPVLRGEMTAEEGFIYRFQKGFEDVGIKLNRQEALDFRDAYQEAQKHITVDPITEKLLTECKEIYSGIGLITNGKGPHQRAKIEQLGLTKWIDEKLIVISGEIGIDKPDPGIFEHAANLADAAPAELTYVGDSMENDILPAGKAGWNAVLWDWNKTKDAVNQILLRRE